MSTLCAAVTRIRTWVSSATTRGTDHYTITAIELGVEECTTFRNSYLTQARVREVVRHAQLGKGEFLKFEAVYRIAFSFQMPHIASLPQLQSIKSASYIGRKERKRAITFLAESDRTVSGVIEEFGRRFVIARKLICLSLLRCLCLPYGTRNAEML